jgi:cell division protein FtsW
VSAGALSLGRLGGASKSKARSKKRARRAQVSTEYNMLLTATLCLLALGAVMVFSASSTTRVLQNGGLSDSAFYLKRTLMFGAVGLIVMHVVARHGLVAVRRLTPALLGVSMFLLVVVLGAGSSVNGASRWLGSGFLQIQPSELAKVALVLYGADLLARKPKRVRSIEGFMPFLLVVGAACLLIMLEPDMGTTMVVTFAVGATLLAAGARPRDLALIALGIGTLALLMTIVEPYRMARLTGFLNPGTDAEGAGFQAAQAKIALGSGGLFGVGIGNGVQKAFYLPEAHTDMISAVIGEELGFVGIAGVVGLFAMLGYAGLKVAQRARDNYGKLLVAGLTSLILVQATINLFAVMGLAPLTGVPLPFVSYGNSSLMATLFAVGLILNVARGGTASASASGGRVGGRKSHPRTFPGRGKAAGGRTAGRSTGAGKLRGVEGGRSPARERSRSSGARRAKSGGGGGGNRGPRRSRHGGRRRASG